MSISFPPSRVTELKWALALCGASDAASQKLIDGILAEHGAEGFLTAFLDARGLEDSSARIRDVLRAREEVLS